MKSDRNNVILAAILAACGLFATAQAQVSRPPTKTAEPEQSVAKLIEQLGADDFSVRQQAQAQLSRMGLEAFDALVAAQYPPSSMEVQLRAKYLVRGMNVRWYEESDPPEVAKLLKSFGDQSDDERRSRIDRLGSMTDIASITALCRLARYEVNPVLSKHAAILIMHRDEPKTAELRDKTIAAITQGIGASKRQATAWLQLYCRTLADPAATVAEWQTAIAKEKMVLDVEQPSMSSRQLVRDLYRYQIKLLQQLKRDAEVIALMRQSIELLDGDPEQVKEIVGWLVHRRAYQVVLEVGDRFPHIVGDDGVLMYLRAHAYRELKQPELAQELAAAALKLRPTNLEEHLVVAGKLGETWGLFDYSEQEYREIMKAAPPGSVADFRARFQLSEQLHDQARELAAGECLKPAIDLMFPDGDEAKGEVARDTALRAGRDPDGARSRMNYFFACHYREQKEFDKEKKALAAAIASDPTDADVLIAQFRLPNLTAEERAEVNEQIESAADRFFEMVKEGRQDLQNADNEPERASVGFQLSSACNQYAWLVSNTQGDFDEALKCSRQSVELRPEEGGFWDTLGRCYYAKGDFENAVKEQSQAVKLMPHAGQIRRQLELFQKALAEQKGGSQK